MLSMPPTAKSVLVHLPNGDLTLHRLVSREFQDRKELHRYTKYLGLGESQQASVGVTLRPLTGSTTLQIENASRQLARPLAASRPAGVKTANIPGFSSSMFGGGDILADDLSLTKSLAAEQEVLDAQIATLRQDCTCANAAILQVLAQTQKVDPGNTSRAWWNWWIEENERYAKRKPLIGYTHFASEINPATELGTVYARSSVNCSCLIAGTLIQTSCGLVAVDKLQIGDRVMSQDIETGELSLKPVIQTTIRPPETTLAILTEEETIHATPGHCWWVSGQGWLRTKELQPGMMLHTARGNTEIEGIEQDTSAAETYNLVVADFNTYFVGQQRILSYDNTQVKPTLRALPGYGQVAMKR
jgi:hypothetical protein